MQDIRVRPTDNPWGRTMGEKVNNKKLTKAKERKTLQNVIYERTIPQWSTWAIIFHPKWANLGVPGVTPGSSLCPWCFEHSSCRGGREEPNLDVCIQQTDALWIKICIKTEPRSPKVHRPSIDTKKGLGMRSPESRKRWRQFSFEETRADIKGEVGRVNYNVACGGVKEEVAWGEDYSCYLEWSISLKNFINLVGNTVRKVRLRHIQPLLDEHAWILSRLHGGGRLVMVERWPSGRGGIGENYPVRNIINYSYFEFRLKAYIVHYSYLY